MTDHDEERVAPKSSKKSKPLSQSDEEDQMSTDDIKPPSTSKQSFIESRLKEIQAQLSGEKHQESDESSKVVPEPVAPPKRNMRVIVQEKSNLPREARHVS